MVLFIVAVYFRRGFLSCDFVRKGLNVVSSVRVWMLFAGRWKGYIVVKVSSRIVEVSKHPVHPVGKAEPSALRYRDSRLPSSVRVHKMTITWFAVSMANVYFKFPPYLPGVVEYRQPMNNPFPSGI